MDEEESYSTIAKGSLWQFASFFAVKFLSLVFTIVLTRLFAPEDIGNFYVALSAVTIFTLFSDFGLSNVLSVYVPFYEGKKKGNSMRKLIAGSFAMGIASSLALLSIFTVFQHEIAGLLKNDSLAGILAIFGLYFVLQTVFQLGGAALMGLRHAKDVAISQAAQMAARIALIPAMLYFLGSNAVSLTLLFITSFAVGSIIHFYYLKRSLDKVPKSSEIVSYAGIFREVLPFGASSFALVIINALYANSDRLFLSNFLGKGGAGEIAVYSIAMGLVTLLQLFSSSIGGIFVPVVAHIYGQDEKDPTRIVNITNSALKWSLALSFPVFLLLIVYSGDVLGILYGAKYANGGNALAVLAVGFLFFTLGYHQRNVLSSIKRADVASKIIAVSLVFNIALNIMLIPVFGIVGAAIAFAAFQFAWLMLTYYYSSKLFGFAFYSAVFRLLGLFIVLLPIVYITRPFILGVAEAAISLAQVAAIKGALKFLQLGVIALLLYLLYFLPAVALKSFTKKELETIANALGRFPLPRRFIDYINNLPHS